jgi:hypothetical protein
MDCKIRLVPQGIRFDWDEFWFVQKNQLVESKNISSPLIDQNKTQSEEVKRMNKKKIKKTRVFIYIFIFNKKPNIQNILQHPKIKFLIFTNLKKKNKNKTMLILGLFLNNLFIPTSS